MLLRNDFNSYGRIRRKAYHADDPELRFACTFKTYGLIIEKQSCKMRLFEHYLNLLK